MITGYYIASFSQALRPIFVDVEAFRDQAIIRVAKLIDTTVWPLFIETSNVGGSNVGGSIIATPNAATSIVGASSVTTSNIGSPIVGASNVRTSNVATPNVRTTIVATPNVGGAIVAVSNAASIVGASNASTANVGGLNIGTLRVGASNVGLPPFNKNFDVLLFFKFYDPDNATIEYKCHMIVSVETVFSDLLPELARRANLSEDTEVCYCFSAFKFYSCFNGDYSERR